MGQVHRISLLLASAAVIVVLAGCSGSTPTPGGQPATPAPGASATDTTSEPTPEARGTGLLLATQAASDGLVWVDPADRTGSAVVDRVEVGPAPWGVAVHEASGTAFVSTALGVAVVDLRARERTALIEYRNQPDEVAYGEFRAGGMGIAVSPDGERVYVAVYRSEGTSVLEVVDVAERRVVAAVPVGLRPFDVLVSADGSEAYTVDHDSFTVHIVDTSTLHAEAVTVAPFGAEGGLASWEKPHYAALADDGDLLLPYQGLVLARLDPGTGRITTTAMTADTHQHGVRRTAEGTLLVVGTGPFGNASGGPSLTIRDMATGEEKIVPTDRPHETVTTWAAADGSLKAVLSGGYTRPGWWNGATVVDLQTYDTYEIQIPGRPQAIVQIGSAA